MRVMRKATSERTQDTRNQVQLAEGRSVLESLAPDSNGSYIQARMGAALGHSNGRELGQNKFCCERSNIPLCLEDFFFVFSRGVSPSTTGFAQLRKS